MSRLLTVVGKLGLAFTIGAAVLQIVDAVADYFEDRFEESVRTATLQTLRNDRAMEADTQRARDLLDGT